MARTRREKIQKMQSRPKFIKAIVYGNPGSGKTVLVGTSPRCLILNADGSDAVESARHHGSNAYVWDITDYDDLDEAYNLLRHTKHNFEWVWFDSITLFQELGMDQIMAEVIKEKAWRDPDVPDVKEYLKNQNRLSKWIRHMKALPFHFGITAHVMRFEDEDDGTIVNMPAIAGGGKIPLSSKICAYVSVVGRLHVVKRKEEKRERRVRVLQTEEDSKWYAKDRFGILGTRIINPTIPKIQDLILGGENAES